MNTIENNKELVMGEIDMHIKGLSKEIAELERIKSNIRNSHYQTLIKDTHQYMKTSERHMLARRLLYNIASFEKELPVYKQYDDTNCGLIAEAFEVEFTLEKDGWYHVIVPPIPTKRNREKSKYFSETIFNIIVKRAKEMQFKEEKTLPKFVYGTLIYIHHLDINSPFKCIPDVDNIDEKGITDVFAETLFVSDSMHHLDVLNLSVFDERAFTEVFIMDQNNIIKWLETGVRFFTDKGRPSCIQKV